MVATEDKLIGGGVLTLVLLGVGAYLIFKKEIGSGIEGVTKGASDIVGGSGDLVKGTVGSVNTVTGETADLYKSMMDFLQSV